MDNQKLATWLGLLGLTMTLAACPGDDGSSTNTSITPLPTTGMNTTGDPPATTTEDPTGSMATTMSEDPTTGGPPGVCEPACLPTEMCVDGICIPTSDDTTGPPPKECGTNVSTMNPACDECSHANCCDEVQACFGDETVMMNTPCLDLNNCIATDCGGATDLMMLEDCIDMVCPELAGELNTWLAFNNCVFMNCQAQCAGG